MGSGSPDSHPPGVAPEIQSLVEEVAARLRIEGRAALADGLIEQLNAPRPTKPTVIVAGEDKRGKSSLVNALLGQADLSPIGAEVVTGSPISFVHSPVRRASIHRYGDAEPQEVDFDQARRLATIQGNPQNAENIRSVELGIDHPLLEEFVLLDTPGVGGLNSGHAELTLQSLVLADALVFVIDANAQIRAGELEFLRRASSRIDTVIIALTKTDIHRGWRVVMDDDRKILAEQAPRFVSAPFLPVSNVLALRAVGLEDPEEVADIRAESGFTELESLLRHLVVERAAVLSDANRLRAAVGPLVTSARSARNQLAATDDGSDAGAQLAREQARLKELSSEKADWPRKLDVETRRITLQRSENLARGLADIRRRYDGRLKQPSKQDMASLPGELIADLSALAGRLNEEANEGLTALLRGLLADVEPPDEIDESVRRLTSDRLTEQLDPDTVESRRLSHYDHLTIVSSFASGRSLSTLFTGGALSITAGVSFIPGVGIAVGVGLGALYAYQVFKGRRQALFNTEFRSWMTEQFAATQTTVNMTFQRELIDVQDQMRQFVRTTLAAKEAEIQEAIRSAQALRASAVEDRKRARADLITRIEAIQGLQARVNDALGRLQAAVNS